MVTWRKTIRTINGKRRAVKVRRTNRGTELVRVLNKKNYSDRTAPKRLRKRRVQGYYNHPDKVRKNYSR